MTTPATPITLNWPKVDPKDPTYSIFTQLFSLLQNFFQKLAAPLQAFSQNGAFSIPVLASDPTSPQNGQMWYNSTSGTFKCYQNGAIKTFTTS